MSFERVSRFGLVNAYLVVEDDGLTLIDTAVTGSAKPILAAAERLGAPIRRIVLTHAHGDHVGSLDALAAAAPRRRGADLGAGGAPAPQGQVAGAGGAAGPAEGWLPGDRDAADRGASSPGKRSARWRSSPPPATPPGTSPCSTSATRPSSAATPSPPSEVSRPPPRSTRCSRCRASPPGTSRRRSTRARSLRTREPRALAPGHGKVVEDPAAAMDAAIAKAS